MATYNNKVNEPIFPNGYLQGGYFEDNDKKTLKKEYIVDYPQYIVKNLKTGRELNKSTQIRKYYDFAVRIKEALKYNYKTFDEVYSEINKLDYHVSYAESRGKVSKDFLEFIKKNLKAINTKEDFFAFTTHFEAIIAYLPKDR